MRLHKRCVRISCAKCTLHGAPAAPGGRAWSGSAHADGGQLLDPLRRQGRGSGALVPDPAADGLDEIGHGAADVREVHRVAAGGVDAFASTRTDPRNVFSTTVPSAATPWENSSRTRRRWWGLCSPHSQSAHTVRGYSPGSAACNWPMTRGRPAAKGSASFTWWWKTSVRPKPSSAEAFTSAVCRAASRAPAPRPSGLPRPVAAQPGGGCR